MAVLCGIWCWFELCYDHEVCDKKSGDDVVRNDVIDFCDDDSPNQRCDDAGEVERC